MFGYTNFFDSFKLMFGVSEMNRVLYKSGSYTLVSLVQDFFQFYDIEKG